MREEKYFSGFINRCRYIVLPVLLGVVFAGIGTVFFNGKLFDDQLTRDTKKILKDNNIKQADESYEYLFENIHKRLAEIQNIENSVGGFGLQIKLPTSQIFLAAEYERTAEIREKENRRDREIQRREDKREEVRLALIKQNKDDEDARLTKEREELARQKLMFERKLMLARIPAEIKQLEDLIVFNREKIRKSIESTEKFKKDIETWEKANRLDTRRLPNVPVVLQKVVVDRINIANSKISKLTMDIKALEDLGMVLGNNNTQLYNAVRNLRDIR